MSKGMIRRIMRTRKCVLPVLIGVLLLVGSLAGLELGRPAEAAPLATRSALTVTEIEWDGTEESLSSGNADGHKFYNDGKCFVQLVNDYTGTVTVTVTTPGTFLGLAIEDLTVAVPATTTYFIGPLKPSLFNQTSGSDKGMVYMDYSSVTSVTVGVWGLD